AASLAAAGRVEGFVGAEGVPAPEVCQNVADSVGALGFFIEGLQQASSSGARFEFDATTGRFDAVLDEARPDPRTVVVSLDATTESLLAQHARQAADLVAALVERPNDANLRDSLRRTLAKVRDDAHLADDDTLKAAANEAFAGLEASTGDGLSALQAAIGKLCGDAAPAVTEPVSVEPERPEAEVD